ncbi:unnamed protein product [Rhizopus microsporus]
MIFILILLHVAAVTCTKSLCLDQTDPLSINSRQWIECPFVSHQNEKRSSQSAPFTVTFHCFDLAPDDCIKAERAFKKAGDMLSSYIVFNEPVRVNATLVSFCKQLTQCDDNSTLGGSLPLRSMPLMNRDGVVRLHPQALVKQLQLRHHPAYAPFDIQSLFNADAPFWFDEDDVPIARHQADFTFVILHELIHGLGFYSGWSDYLVPDTLTPSIGALSKDMNLQFMESAMDRLLYILQDATPVSTISQNLDAMVITNELLKTPASDMYRLATTPHTLGLIMANHTLVLETSLTPFRSGSSLSHVAQDIYKNTPDFLMRFSQERGVSLSDAMTRVGTASPLGPATLAVLDELGYTVVDQAQINMNYKHTSQGERNSLVWLVFLVTAVFSFHFCY